MESWTELVDSWQGTAELCRQWLCFMNDVQTPWAAIPQSVYTNAIEGCRKVIQNCHDNRGNIRLEHCLCMNKRKKIMGTAGHTIEDNILRQAVQQAAATDLYCSPAADIVRLNVGIEYELILQQKLYRFKNQMR